MSGYQGKERKEFPLLSDALREALHDPCDYPVYKRWVREFPAEAIEALDDIFFDELKIIEAVRYMLDRASQLFSFFPEQVMRLGRSYSTAMIAGDYYKRFALNSQLRRFEAASVPQGEIASAEKALRSIERAIIRRIERIKILMNEDKIEDQLVQRARRMVSAKKATKLELPGILDRLRDDQRKIIAKRNAELEVAISEYWDLNLKEEELRDFLHRQMSVDIGIRTTRESLSQLGGPIIIEPQPNSISSVDPSPTLFRQSQLDEPAENPSSDGPRVKRKAVKRKDADEEEPLPERVESTPFDAATLTIEKLNQAIALAAEHGKIRIVVPKIGGLQARFEAKWREVFARLDYTGRLEFVVFTDLGRTTERQSPIIIPKTMNTHRNLWDRQSFQNVLILDLNQPGSIISHLDSIDQ